MKFIGTWLNEEQYKEFRRRVQKLNTTPYKALKKLVIQFLNDEKAAALLVYFWAVSYAMLATTYILIH